MSSGTNNIPPLPDSTGFTLQRRRKVVLVVDLVESVSLMQADELGVITRWQAFLAHVNQVILPANKGRLVKSLGDGLMVEFDSARNAAAAAIAAHAWMSGQCDRLATGSRLRLRAGIHDASVFVFEHDLYGAGVNLAARIAEIAGPGQTVCSAEVRDDLTDDIDCKIEDLGECWLRHLDQPIRAFRLAEVESASDPVPGPAPSFQPVIAIVPFGTKHAGAAGHAIGDLVADGIIGQLASTPELHVISRLSTAALRSEVTSLVHANARLQAHYVVSGQVFKVGRRLLLTAELIHAHSQQVLWTDRRMTQLSELLAVRSEPIDQIAAAIHDAVLSREVRLACTAPMPTLSSYSLMLGGINLMHRSTRDEFLRSRAVLEHLIDRHRRHPLARAWLAKWYVLSATRGLSESLSVDGSRALDQTRRALDADANHSLALAMEGFVCCHLLRDFDRAAARLDEAIEHNPSESLAWLFKGMLLAFKGLGSDAVAASDRARRLSPLDPLAYYYESLSASMAVVAGDYAQAIRLAHSSLRRNAIHASTYRALAVAQVLSGDGLAARRTVRQLLTLDPRFTLERFKKTYAGADQAPAVYQTLADALREAGIPP